MSDSVRESCFPSTRLMQSGVISPHLIFKSWFVHLEAAKTSSETEQIHPALDGRYASFQEGGF